MDQPGKIITFYSYKGGTGRSMVLANTAWILASQGKRVLVIDWDLEAPGLHRYFHPFLIDPELSSSEGLIDFVVDYQLRTYRPPASPPAQEEAAAPELPVMRAEGGSGAAAITFTELAGGSITATITENAGGSGTLTLSAPVQAAPAAKDAAPDPAKDAEQEAGEDPEKAGKEAGRDPKQETEMKAHAARVMRYVQSLEWEFPDDGTLDFIPAGQQGAGYAACVNSFHWSDFYRANRGEELFQKVRELLVDEYQYVLIDSRTGVSDTSGICTVQMPDTLVVCFTLNNQGIEGASGVARSVMDQRRGRKIDIFPVPMRVENNEKEKLESRKIFAQNQFARFHFALPHGENRESYWNKVLFPYVPFYAYEEILATFGDRQADATSLIAPALRLTAYLNDGREIPFRPPSEKVRAEILAKYARNSMVVERTSERRAREAEEIYLRLSPSEQGSAYRVFTRLVQLAEPGEGADTWVQVPLAAFDEAERRVAREFNGTAVRVARRDTAGEIVQTADEQLLTAWKRLADWTVGDRGFLLWRRRLATSLSEWVNGEQDDSDLLTGARLSAARHWLRECGDRLTAREREFIQRSTRRHDLRRRLVMVQRVTASLAAVAVLLMAMLAYGGSRRSQERSRQAEARYARTVDSLRVANLLQSGADNQQVGNFERAMEDFQAALAIDSANSQAYFGLGSARYQRGEVASAVSAFSQAARTSPGNWRVYDARAQAYLDTRDTTRARADLQQVVRLAPDDSIRQDRLRRLRFLTANQIPVDSIVRVNIRYRSRADRELASRVQQELGRTGYTVLTVEYREEISTTPVRYFYPEDRQQAEYVAQRVQAALASLDIPLDITADQIGNFRNLPRGRIEVWLPRISADVEVGADSAGAPTN